MLSRACWFYCGLVAACAVASSAQERPAFTGYVTRAASNSDFDVNGVRILCDAKTLSELDIVRGMRRMVRGCPHDAPYVGQALVLYGYLNEKANTYDTIRIEKQPIQLGEISGSAVIDAPPVQVLNGSPQGPDLMIRADGYRIRITGRTKIEWNQPLQNLADVKAGDWIKYNGDEDAAGVVMAASARIGPLVIPSAEEKLRKETEYDPTAVPQDAKQGRLRSALASYDLTKFPPYLDAAMQARVEKIGISLIPAYQRELPDSDPTKVNFRFQVIEGQGFLGAFALPSGIILIPQQVVERMQNDSQLAAILADRIACVLERQSYRDLPPSRALAASEVGAAVVAAFVPGGYLAESMIGGTRDEKQASVAEQSGRVSLDLLKDAGYDIDQAPIAWWLIATNKPKPLTKVDMPDRAIYLYRILGESWNSPAAAAQQSR